MNLYDHETAELIGPATPEQQTAAEREPNGVILITEDGDPISAKDATRLPEEGQGRLRTVYVDD